MNTLKNSSLFIVPNSLMSKESDLWDVPLSPYSARLEKIDFKMRTKELAPFGIKTTLDDTFVQVWIHCEGSDNLTDHGFDEDQIKELFPSKDLHELIEQDRHYSYSSAPGFLPIHLFEGKKEGDSITLTTEDGVEWSIKLEQLPYRYGHFGRFEDVLARLISKDRVTAVERRHQADVLRNFGFKSEYSENAFNKAIVKMLGQTIKTDSSEYGTYFNLHKREFCSFRETIRFARVNEGVAEILQHNLAEAYDENRELFMILSNAFRDVA